MSNKTKAVMLMLLSSLGFAFMGATVKLSGDLPTIQKVLFRNLISLIIAFISIRKSKKLLLGKWENQKYLLARSISGLTGMILYFYSIEKLPLSDSSMLNKLSPFFITLFAIIFLKEKLTSTKVISMIVVFVGAILIIKPQFNLTIIPALSGFLSAMFAGISYTIVRFLKNREEPSTIVFYFSLISVIGSLPFVIMNFKVMTILQVIYLLFTGIFAAIAQFSLTYAYKYSPASEVAIYNYSNIIFSCFIGYVLWSEIPDFLSLIGGIIIIGTSIIVYIINKKE